jgi:hypothetical protein
MKKQDLLYLTASTTAPDAPEHRDTPLGTPGYLGGYSIKS